VERWGKAGMGGRSSTFVISIMSRDRIGIVHQVSRAIGELGGDIADLRQSVLRGYFTMILLASFPAGATAGGIRRKLSAIVTGDLPSLEIGVKEATDVFPAQEASALEDAYVLTARGQDRIGFVATVSSFCADNDINILDLSSTVRDGMYTMILLVDLSRGCDVGDIRRKLKRFEKDTALKVVLQHYDIFRATNEVSVR
jgi:predicted amino acid-binding ACT domain protein